MFLINGYYENLHIFPVFGLESKSNLDQVFLSLANSNGIIFSFYPTV